MRKCTICNKPLDQCPHVPAKRYDIFIKAFEKFVADRQEEVKQVDRLMRPYEIVREAIERCNFDPSINVALHLKTDGVKVKILVHQDQPPKLFEPLERLIGEGLVAAKLHRDGVGARRNSGSFYKYLVWKLHSDEGKPQEVCIETELPILSGRHVKVTRKERLEPAYTITEYKVDWTDQPIIAKVTHDDQDEREKDEKTPF